MSDKTKTILAWVLGIGIVAGAGYGGYRFAKGQGWLDALGAPPAGAPAGGTGSGGSNVPNVPTDAQSAVISALNQASDLISNSGLADAQKIALKNIYVSPTLSRAGSSDIGQRIFDDSLAKGIDLLPYVLAKAIIAYKKAYGNDIDRNKLFNSLDNSQARLHADVTGAIGKLGTSNYVSIASKLHHNNKGNVLFANREVKIW